MHEMTREFLKKLIYNGHWFMMHEMHHTHGGKKRDRNVVRMCQHRSFNMTSMKRKGGARKRAMQKSHLLPPRTHSPPFYKEHLGGLVLPNADDKRQPVLDAFTCRFHMQSHDQHSHHVSFSTSMSILYKDWTFLHCFLPLNWFYIFLFTQMSYDQEELEFRQEVIYYQD